MGRSASSESVPNFIRLLFCERLLCRVEILERDVQLDTIEAGRFDAADHLRHRVGYTYPVKMPMLIIMSPLYALIIKLVKAYCSLLVNGSVTAFHARDGPNIVASGDLGFLILFDGAEKARHRALKSIGEPDPYPIPVRSIGADIV